MNKYKILIIGCNGFIGSHLTEYLINRGFAISGLDIQPLSNPRLNSYYKVETNFSELIEFVFKYEKFDYCINASGAADVSASIINPNHDFQLNTYNVLIILNSLRIFLPECKLINISSAAVYGKVLDVPIKENVALNPVSPYGYHKKASELICEEFRNIYGLQVCSLRVFSAYGIGLKKQIFWDVYQKATRSSTIELFGTGDEIRDFIHVDDIAEIINILVIKNELKHTEINIGNGVGVKIKDAVNEFLESIKKNDVEIVFIGSQKKGDPDKYIADITRIKELGYQPKSSLSEGFSKYYDWIQSFNLS